jgi:hypothetical protein
VKSVQSTVNLAEIVVLAGTRLGLQKQEMAAMFELSPSDFTAAFDCTDDRHSKRNRLMKVALPMALARQIAVQLCEATGLAVAGPDMERSALGDLLAACAAYIRVVQR